MKDKITSKEILEALSNKYSNTAKYIVPNVFLFKHGWESDLFIQQKNSGYCYEIEVKVSRADFFNDFRKAEKHTILKTGEYKNGWITNEKGDKEARILSHKNRPNKFFYCVPNGLIKVSEIPDYSGLMYFNANGRTIETIKEAPFIHRDQLDLEKKLCEKFYYYWKGALIEKNRLCKEINRINGNIENK